MEIKSLKLNKVKHANRYNTTSPVLKNNEDNHNSVDKMNSIKYYVEQNDRNINSYDIIDNNK